MIGRKEKPGAELDRERLRAAIEASGQSLRKIAADAKISDGTVRAYLDGKTDKMNNSTADKLALSLGHQSWADLVGRRSAAAAGPRRLTALPIYRATARPDTRGSFLIDMAAPIEHRNQVPPALVQSHRAFAFRLPIFEFAPRFQSGELIAVDPDRAPGVGDDALVQMGAGYIVGTISMADSEGIQMQVGRNTKSIAQDSIKSIAYILTRGDFLGS
jgi:lambda repressor-like predicted transcriptional regulator